MGGDTRYELVRLRSLVLGGDGRARVDSVVAGLSVGGTLRSTQYDALIGTEYLQRFRVIFDYPHQRLILEPRVPALPAGDVDMSGLFLVTPDSARRRITVKAVAADGPAAAAGIVAGDLIVGLDQLPEDRILLATVRRHLRSGAGHRVRVTLLRGGDRRTVEIVLRAVVERGGSTHRNGAATGAS